MKLEMRWVILLIVIISVTLVIFVMYTNKNSSNNSSSPAYIPRSPNRGSLKRASLPWWKRTDPGWNIGKRPKRPYPKNLLGILRGQHLHQPQLHLHNKKAPPKQGPPYTPTYIPPYTPTPSTTYTPTPSTTYTPTPQPLKILCLHGGGGSVSGLQSALLPLQTALGSNIYFVYASAPHSSGVWYLDPPNGKNNPTTDPNWASQSFSVLDNIVSTQGPFDGILGYSQGSAMSYLYLSAYPNSFRFIVTFCGFLPTTHIGLNNRITTASFAIPSLFYYGTNDTIISNIQTTNAAAHFPNPVIISDSGNHTPPTSGAAFTAVVNFIRSFLL